MPQKILFVTGDRAEYDIQYALIAAADRAADFAPELLVAGSHTAAAFGGTVSAIEADGFPIRAVRDTLLASEHPTARAKSAAIEMAAIADVVRDGAPDLLVVMGDREDTLAAALVGVYAEIPVIHLGGGDRGANAHPDNPVRDAVTKLAHIHLTSSEESLARVIAMGEAPWRAANIGATGLDRLASTPALAPAALWAHLGVPPIDGPYLVVIQHVMPPERDRAAAQMRATLEAVADTGLPAFVSRPNSDGGGSAMRAEIDRAVAAHPQLRRYDSLGRSAFVSLLKGAAAVVGNSSAGLIETPFLGLPAVNIGRRQAGRQHAENVIHVGHDRAEIRAAVETAVGDAAFRARAASCDNPYGDGRAGERGVAFIRGLANDRARLLTKVQTL